MNASYVGTLDSSNTDLYVTSGVAGYTDENGNALQIDSGQTIDMPDGSTQLTPYGAGVGFTAQTTNLATPIMTSSGSGNNGLLSGAAGVIQAAGSMAATTYAQVNAPTGTVVNPKTGSLQSASTSLLSSPILILGLVGILALLFWEHR